MAASSNIQVGPVLSFRGVETRGRAATWRVTALIGVTAGSPAPAFVADGRPVPAPVTLWETGGMTFLRYDCSIKLTGSERLVKYGVDGTDGWTFTAPAQGAPPRVAYVSCNGFSDPDAARKMKSAINDVWADLLANHDPLYRNPKTFLLDKEQRWHEAARIASGGQRFHLLLMGGDQVYLDSIWEENAFLREWVALSRSDQVKRTVTRAVAQNILDYYVQLYVARWLPSDLKGWAGAVNVAGGASAMASMPTVMMWDDHDIFDGWGSYPREMQDSPVFHALFDAARKAMWVFQLHQRIEDLPPLVALTPLSKTDDPHLDDIDWGAVRAKDKLSLPFLDHQPGFSFALQVGALEVLALDLRTERSQRQILGSSTWNRATEWLKSTSEPARVACQHVLVMSSVPAVHPKLGAAESVLDVVSAGNVVSSMADDLRDHWSHDDHDGERKRLFRNLVDAGRTRKLRVTLVSGDVHVAAWGTVARNDVTPASNWLRVHQLTSSAVMHPTLSGLFERAFLAVLNLAARETQANDTEYTAEMMLVPGHDARILAARNWLALEMDEGLRLWATWRAETGERFSNHLLAIHPANQQGI